MPPSIEAKSMGGRSAATVPFGGMRMPPSIEAWQRSRSRRRPGDSAACACRPPLKLLCRVAVSLGESNSAACACRPPLKRCPDHSPTQHKHNSAACACRPPLKSCPSVGRRASARACVGRGGDVQPDLPRPVRSLRRPRGCGIIWNDAENPDDVSKQCRRVPEVGAGGGDTCGVDSRGAVDGVVAVAVSRELSPIFLLSGFLWRRRRSQIPRVGLDL